MRHLIALISSHILTIFYVKFYLGKGLWVAFRRKSDKRCADWKILEMV